MRKATFSATFWRFVGDAKSKSCENIWHLVSRAKLSLVLGQTRAPSEEALVAKLFDFVVL